MQFSFITPTYYIPTIGKESDFILALSHLIKEEENEYEKAIKETKLPILLDNGCFENGIPEGVNDLIKKAKKINAIGFFAPDHLYNSKKTEKALEITWDILTQLKVKGLKLGAVVQADNKKEWIEQYIKFSQDERIDIIGLSILSIPYCWKKNITESRLECLKEIFELNVKHKRCHMLGLGESYEDIKFAIKNCPWIQSNDSSSCFVTGVNKIEYNEDLTIPGGKIKEKLNFSLNNLNEEQIKIINNNIKKVKNYDYKS